VGLGPGRTVQLGPRIPAFSLAWQNSTVRLRSPSKGYTNSC
jgi:hypothetical protein